MRPTIKLIPIRVWDFPTRRELASFQTFSGQFELDSFNRHHAVAVSPNGQILAAGGPNKEIVLWDLHSRQKLATLIGHTDTIRHLDFSPDSLMLASTSRDGTIRLWDAQTNSFRKLAMLPQGREALRCAFSPMGRTLATSGGGRYVRLWDVSSFEPKGTTWQFRDFIGQLVFSSDGKYLAGVSSGDQEQLRVWDVAEHREIAKTNLEQSTWASASFSGEGNILATCNEHQRVLLVSVPSLQVITLWDLAKPGLPILLTGHTRDEVLDIAFSKDGKQIASAGGDGLVGLWDAPTFEEIASHTGVKKTIK